MFRRTASILSYKVIDTVYIVLTVHITVIVIVYVIMMMTTVVLVTMLSLLLWQWGDFPLTTAAATTAAMGAPAYGDFNESAQQEEVIHIVYALDPIMMPLTIVSVKSVVEVTRNRSLLSFHFVTVGLTWHDDFLADMKRSLCIECSFESVKWNPPAIITTMLVLETYLYGLHSCLISLVGWMDTGRSANRNGRISRQLLTTPASTSPRCSLACFDSSTWTTMSSRCSRWTTFGASLWDLTW